MDMHLQPEPTPPFSVRTFIILFIICGVLLSIFYFNNPERTQAQFTDPHTPSLGFTRPLKLGDVSVDVVELQKVLNSDTDTVVSNTGPGSSGQETSRFGSLTQKAVVKFQNKYASEVLVPAGLYSGTGYVGPLTIKKLNSILTSQSNTPIPSPVSTSEQPSICTSCAVDTAHSIDIFATDKTIQGIQDSIKNKITAAALSGTVASKQDIFSSFDTLGSVKISGLSLHATLPGATLAISGGGFAIINDIYFGPNYIVKNVRSPDGKVITLTIPSLPPGVYSVAVKNSLGLSNTNLLAIISSSAAKLSLTSASDTTFGQSLTLTGTGFTPSDNVAITSLGTYKNLTSIDGKTISLPFAPDSLKTTQLPGKKAATTKVYVYLMNSNGFTETPLSFTLHY